MTSLPILCRSRRRVSVACVASLTRERAHVAAGWHCDRSPPSPGASSVRVPAIPRPTAAEHLFQKGSH